MDTPPKRELGEPCSGSWECRDEATPARVCLEKRCVTREVFEARAESASRKASGLGPETETTEPSPEAPAVPEGFNVRILRASGVGRIYAACQPEEFLIGGGCNVPGAESGPIEKQPGTTRGGRWQCVLQDAELEAHVFCMRPK